MFASARQALNFGIVGINDINPTAASVPFGGVNDSGLGREGDLGAVEVGRIADLTAYRLDGISFTPPNDLLRQLVYAETGSNLDISMVAGEIVMRVSRMLTAVEAHAEGEPGRVITGDMPNLRGDSVFRKMQDMATRHDDTG